MRQTSKGQIMLCSLYEPFETWLNKVDRWIEIKCLSLFSTSVKRTWFLFALLNKVIGFSLQDLFLKGWNVPEFSARFQYWSPRRNNKNFNLAVGKAEKDPLLLRECWEEKRRGQEVYIL